MKKLTTNQMLIGGWSICALIYILYKKKKAKNGSEMIQDALNGANTRCFSIRWG